MVAKYNLVLVSGVQHSDSVSIYIYTYIHTHTHTHIYRERENIYILFQIIFPYRLLQNTEFSFLCYTVGPCCLSILCIVVCIC